MPIKNNELTQVSTVEHDPSRGTPVTTTALELNTMLIIYDRLIMHLRENCDDGLELLTDNLIALVVRCRTALANGMEEQAGLQMMREMREELRLLPGTLRSLLPGIGPRLCESMEYKLGIQFSRF